MDPMDLRGHITLVRKEYGHKTGNLPKMAWEAWVVLMAEARRNAALRGLKPGQSFRVQAYELYLETSSSVDGWKTDKLVEGMAGEQPPKAAPAAAYISMGVDQPKQEEKKRRGLLERVRG